MCGYGQYKWFYFYIKEDSENPYVKDAFERLLTRRFSDLEISSFDVSERPTIEENDFQSLSEFVANPKFKTRPPVNMNAFSDENKTALLQIIKEHQYIEELKQYNLKVDNKILLHGSSGCGKTTTAKAIAHTLDKKIIIINFTMFR